MNALELLEQRRSASKLTEPAPPAALLDRVLTAALRAPDHAALRPWRVLVVEGDARAALGEVLARSAASRDPHMDAAQLESTRKKAQRAPLILIVCCTPRPHPKVPEIEQVISAGCVAHTILVGLQAEGFGAMWRTGAAAYDPELRRALGLAPTDHVVGFLYVGTPAAEPPAQHRPTTNDHVVRWSGS